MIIRLLLILLISASQAQAVNLGTFGETYDIVEADLLQAIQERAEKTDWKSLFEKERERIVRSAGAANMPLPAAVDNATHYIDLTRTLDHIIYIRDKQGKPEVLYPKGFRYNVLDYMQSIDTFVVFNGTSPEEIRWYRDKFGEKLNITATITEGNVFDVADIIKRPVYRLTAEVRDRFKLKSTPSVFYQEANRIRVDEYYIKRDSE